MTYWLLEVLEDPFQMLKLLQVVIYVFSDGTAWFLTEALSRSYRNCIAFWSLLTSALKSPVPLGTCGVVGWDQRATYAPCIQYCSKSVWNLLPGGPAAILRGWTSAVRNIPRAYGGCNATRLNPSKSREQTAQNARLPAFEDHCHKSMIQTKCIMQQLIPLNNKKKKKVF